MDDTLNHLVERFDGPHRVRMGDVARAAVEILAPLSDDEREVTTCWDDGLIAEQRQRLLKVWWGKFDGLFGQDRERCRLFIAMIHADQSMDGYDVGEMHAVMLVAGLAELEIRRIFKSVLEQKA